MRTWMRSRIGPPGEPGLIASSSCRSEASRLSACWYSADGSEDWLCSVTTSAALRAHARTGRLPELRIHFLEVVAVHEHLARLAAHALRDEPFRFHHVDQTGRTAEPDPHLALEIRNGRLAGADDDPCRLVVQLVLVELETARPRLLVVRGNRVVEDRLSLLPQEAREPCALLFADIRPVKPDTA